MNDTLLEITRNALRERYRLLERKFIYCKESQKITIHMEADLNRKPPEKKKKEQNNEGNEERKKANRDAA